MKNWLIGIFIVVILVVAAALLYFNRNQTIVSPPTESPASTAQATSTSSSSNTENTTTDCSPADLQAQISTEGAAGNIFGTATIANNGKTPCQIIGNNPLQIGYDPTIKNIKVTLQGQPATATFTIAPGKSVFSQIHYPNGPQCQGAPTQQNITIGYKISASDTVSFRTLDGKTNFSIPVCTNPTEITEIQTWPLSANPITP